MGPDSPTKEEVNERAEMSASCLGMIREMLEGLGIDMTRCPPMFYPEAIKNLYVWTAQASRDCQIGHQWHGGDTLKAGECINSGIKKYGKLHSEEGKGKGK